MAGCACVPQQDYDALAAERDALQAQLEALADAQAMGYGQCRKCW